MNEAQETMTCDSCETEVDSSNTCPDCRRCHVCCRCGAGEG